MDWFSTVAMYLFVSVYNWGLGSLEAYPVSGSMCAVLGMRARSAGI